MISRHLQSYAIAVMATAVIAFHLLPATPLHAEESFAATHICQLGTVSDSGPTLHPGLAIFKVDRASLSGVYRITLADVGSPYTRLVVTLRTGPDSYQTLQEIPWPAGAVTYKGTLQLLVSDMLVALDSGLLYLEARTVAQPDSFLRGQIEQIPSGVGFNILGSNQTPPVNSSGEGHARLYYDYVAGSIRYLVSWSHLSEAATSASFRRGGPGVSGPAAHTLTFAPGDSSVVGTWDGVTAADLDALATGNIYLNITTASHPDGEIRGQLLPIRVLTAAIEPANEVPPLENSGPSGTGVMAIVGAPNPLLDNHYLTATAVAGGTPDSITGADIGLAPIGVNGSTPFTLPHSFDSSYRSQWNITAGGTPGYATVDSITAELSYINFPTPSHPAGAMRGQWILSENNLPVISSVPSLPRPPGTARLTARYDRATIGFRAEGLPSEVGQVRLYSALGQLIGSAPLDGATARMDAASLPSGIYFAELVAGGVRVASVPVLVR
jgi:hypothetical protein